MKSRTLTALAVATAILLAAPAAAQFAGYYAPENWSTTLAGDPPGGGGSVDTSGAPASITLLGGDAGCDQGGDQRTEGEGPSLDCYVLFSIAADGTGDVSFDWDFSTADSVGFDDFGYYLNGTFVQLTDDKGANDQSGSEVVAVTAGDEIGFYLDCTDCIKGAADAVVSNFLAPGGGGQGEPIVSIPTVGRWGMALLALLLVAASAWTLRRRTA